MKDRIRRRLALLLVTATVITDSCFGNIMPVYATEHYSADETEDDEKGQEEYSEAKDTENETDPVADDDQEAPEDDKDSSEDDKDSSEENPETAVEEEVEDEETQEIENDAAAEDEMSDVIVGEDFIENTEDNNAALAGDDEIVEILINDKAFTDGEYVVHYGDDLKFTLENGDAAVFYYADNNEPDAEFEEISDGVCTLSPGDYYLGYETENYSYNKFDFCMRIVSAKIGAPSVMAWDTSSYTDPDNANIVLNYTVPDTTELGEKLVGTPIVTTKGCVLRIDKWNEASKEFDNVYEQRFDVNTANIETPVSFVPQESLTKNGYGDYRFGVKFLSSFSDKYNDSDFIYSNEINPDEGILEFRDIGEPVITDYSYDSESHNLKAKGYDKHTGICAYAFSTVDDGVENPEKIPEKSWTDISKAPVLGKDGDEGEEFSFLPKDGGRYYFYAKDAHGNIARSDSYIGITILKLNNTYKSGVKQETEYRYFNVTSGIILPTALRTGYDFKGWAVGDETSEDLQPSGTSLLPELYETTVELYAKWGVKDVEVSLTPAEGISCEYDAAARKLEAEVSGITQDGDVSFSYKWFKDGVELPDSDSDFVSVRNVSDSGVYKVEVSVNMENEEPIVVESESKTVNITPKNLVVKPKQETITYGMPRPSFVAVYEGLVTGDEEAVDEGYFQCDYDAMSDAGDYNVCPVDFASENYTIDVVSGNFLKVNPKNVNMLDSGVDAVLDQTEFDYDGTAHKPAVTVVDEKLAAQQPLVEGVDYEITYPDPVSASDKAQVNISFKGNYSGIIVKKYAINKTDYQVKLSIKNWKYGDYDDKVNSPDIMVLTGDASKPTPDLGEATIHYLYKGVDQDDSKWSEKLPVNAGDYVVKASIEALSNFNAIESESVEFSIERRIIILQSESGRWTFDGNVYVKPTVTKPASAIIDGEEIVADGLEKTDDFKILKAETAVSQVTSGTKNTIHYEFSSSTNPDNYIIYLVEGNLIVDCAKLNPPTGVIWNEAKPGFAKWIAVTKGDLSVKYELALYKDGEQVSGNFVTTQTSYDFSDIIKGDSSTGGYQVKVKVIPVGGANKDNYSESSFSALTQTLYSVRVNVDSTQSGISGATINDTDSIVMIAGESAALSSTYKTGYKAAETVWVGQSAQGRLGALKIQNNTKANTSISIDWNIDGTDTYTVVAHAQDELPYSAWSFEEDYEDAEGYSKDMSRVKLKLQMQDTLELKDYAVIKLNTKPSDVTLKSVLDAAAGSAVFTAIDQGDVTDVLDSLGQGTVIAHSYETEYTVNEKGYYYLAVRDSKNQISYSPVCAVYAISFDKGEGDVTGEMSPILKVAEYDIMQLPAEKFLRSGYAFTEWSQNVAGQSSAHIYKNKGMYVADGDAVLVAKWSNREYPYYVNYYFMKADGTYEAEADEHAVYTALYGTEIDYTDAKYTKALAGYEIDTDYNDGVIKHETITEDNLHIDIHYKRKQYKITYTYTMSDDPTEVLFNTETYLYGTALGVETKPEDKVGYTFIGWNYDGSGGRPSEMPNHDVIATGYFRADNAEYEIHYFVENLAGTAYDLLYDSENPEVGNEIRTGEHGSQVTFTTGETKEIAGFSISGVSVTYGSESNVYASATSAVGKIDKDAENKLHVNYFYKRNSYTINLNVWLSNKDSEENKLFDAAWTYKYGETLSTAVTDAIATYYETVCVAGGENTTGQEPEIRKQKSASEVYSAASFRDWSTGSAPSTMPAGNVTISRAYILNAEQEYKVNVYFQNSSENYTAVTPRSLSFYAPLGTNVTMIKGTRPAGLDDPTKLYTSQLSSLAYEFDFYELDEETTQEIGTVSGTVTESTTGDETPLCLNVYFKRKKTKLTVYYMEDTRSTGDATRLIGKVTLEGVWGHNAEWGEEANAFNPLLYFNDENYTPILKATGKTYLESEYVVSYTESYQINGAWHYPHYEYTTVNPASDTTAYAHPVVFGTADATVIVTYSSVDDCTFDLDVKYNLDGLHVHDVTYNYKGTDYTFKVVNKSKIYVAVQKETDTSTYYPGAAKLRGLNQKTYGTVSADYVQITDLPADSVASTYEYFRRADNSDKVIYIVKNGDEEEFVSGGWYGINLEKSFVRTLIIDKNVLETYNTAHPSAPMRVYNASADGINYCNTKTEPHTISNRNFTYTFIAVNVYNVFHHVIGENDCRGHEYPEGTVLTADQLRAISCDSKVSKRAGYVLNLYEDEKKTPLKGVTLNSDHRIFAKYEKAILDYTKTISYELADELPTGKYLSAAQLEQMLSEGDDRVVKNTVAIDNDEISDNIDRNLSLEATADIYTFKGEVVLMVEHHRTFSFSTINLPYDDAKYQKANFSFETENHENSLNSYCEAQANNLKAFYVRDRHNLTVDKQNGEDILVSENKVGQTVKLSTPTKDGYAFAGWTIKKLNGDDELITDESVVVNAVSTGYELTMPEYPITAVANWTVAPVELKISYMYQTSKKEYLETLYNSLNTPVVETVKLDGADVSASVYYDGECISINDEGVEKYYTAAKEGGIITASSLGLFAMSKSINPSMDDEIVISTHNVTKEHFSFDHATYKDKDGSYNKDNLSDTITVGYDTELVYYYVRESNLTIKLEAIASDDGKKIDSASTLAAGGYIVAYGEETTLITSVGEGYSFRGWFDRADVMEGPQLNILKSNWSEYTPVYSGLIYNFTIEHSVDMVAIYEPEGISTDITVSATTEKDTYTYGYVRSDIKNLHATVAYPEAMPAAVYIDSYEWIRTDSEGNPTGDVLTGNSASDYKFQLGLLPGTYYYVCKVVIGRTDNGRSLEVVSEPIEITIDKADLVVLAEDYSEVYDGAQHYISVDLDREDSDAMRGLVKDVDYEIYYSETPFELVDGDYDVSGATTTAIGKKDVCLVAGNVDAYKIYYCVKPIGLAAGKYNAVTGYNNIEITPKKLTLIENDNGFIKTFDGKALVEGSVTTPGSDKYRLSNGEDGITHYEVSGYLPGEEENLTLDFDASFDSMHASEASTVTLTNLKVVYKSDGSQDPNYYFPQITDFDIPGYIKQKEVSVSWNDVGPFAYDGESHAPTATLDTVIEDVNITVEGAQINAGSYTAIAQLATENAQIKLSDYKVNGNTQAYEITAPAIVIKAEDTEFTYDKTPHTITLFTVNGNEHLSSGSEVLIGAKTYTVRVNCEDKITAGIYELTPANISIIEKLSGKNVIDNFDISAVKGNLTINKKPVKVLGITAKSKIFDDSEQAELIFTNVTFEGVEAGDSLTLDTTKVTGTFDTKAAGTNKTVTIEIADGALRDSEGVAKNYCLYKETAQATQTTTYTADINNLGISLRPEDIEMVYADDIAFSVVSDTAFKGSESARIWGNIKFSILDNKNVEKYSYTYNIDQASAISIAELASLDAAPAADIRPVVGSYKIKVSGLESDNYNISSTATANLVVNKKAITISANEVSVTDLAKTYDGTTAITAAVKAKIMGDQESYVNYTGVYGADNVSITAFNAAYDNKNVKSGIYEGAQKLILSNITIDNANYVLANSSIELKASIEPKELTITAKNKSAVYGTSKADITFDGTVVGLVSGENIESVATVEYTTAYDENVSENRVVKAGGYEITPLITEKTANYSITPVNGVLTITKAVVSVVAVQGTPDAGIYTFDAATRRFSMTYGNSVKANWFVPKYSGFVYDDNAVSVGIDKDDINYTVAVPKAPVVVGMKGNLEGFPTIAGDYYISVDVSALTAQNYEFRAYADSSRSTLHIDKREIELADDIIHIRNKVYDASIRIYPWQIILGTNTDETISVVPTTVKHYTMEGVESNVTVDVEYFSDKEAVDYSYLDGIGGGDGVLDVDRDHLRETGDTGIAFNYATDKTHHDYKNVAEANTANLVWGLSEYLDMRYRLVNPQEVAPAKIDRRPIKIKAVVQPEEILYGSDAPVFSNEYIYEDAKGVIYKPGFAGTENNSVLLTDDVKPSVIGAAIEFTNPADVKEKWITTYESSQGSYSHTNAIYDVVPYGFVSGNNINYYITYEAATITVAQAKLADPVVTWSNTVPGQVSFTPVEAIGDVKVARYELSLYETGSGDLVKYMSSVSANTAIDLSSDIKAKGAGGYVVKVKAYAYTDSTHNPDHINVDDSDEGVTAKTLYAAEVSVGLKDDGPTGNSAALKAKADAEAYARISIAGNYNGNLAADTSPVVLIAGEKNIPFGMETMKAVATGFKISSVSYTGGKVTFGSNNGTQVLVGEKRNYSNTFSVGDLTSAEPIRVALSLEKEKVSISAKLEFKTKIDSEAAALSDNLKYGYNSVPEFRVIAQVKQGDTVQTSGYTYEFKWYYKQMKETAFADDIPVLNVSEVELPSGLKAGDYTVYCKITATRIDNGEQDEVWTNKLDSTNGKFTINIGKAKIIANARLSKTLSAGGYGWKYGEPRAIPSVEGLPADNVAVPEYYYSNSSSFAGMAGKNPPSGWSSKMLTDAGEHYMVAYIPAQSNYGEVETGVIKYVIQPAKLGNVPGLSIETAVSGNYCKAVWNAADSIWENENTDGISDSAVVPCYKAELYMGAELKKDFAPQSGRNLNLDSYISEAGNYSLKVKAVANPQSTRDCGNANPGDYSVIDFHVGNVTTADESRLSRTYDGTADRIRAVFTPEGKTISTYTWYQNGNVVKSGSEDYLDIRYVEQSGSYYCLAEDTEGNKYISIKKSVSISPKVITITAGSSSKVYDALALTNTTYRVGENNDELCAGDVLSAVFNDTITNAGECSNTMTDVKITRPSDSDKVLYDSAAPLAVNNNYTVTLVSGTLKVTKRPITVSANSAHKEYDKMALSCSGFTYTKAAELAPAAAGLVTGQTISASMTAGSVVTNVNDAPKANVIDKSSIIIENELSENVTDCYDITCVNGSLTLSTVSLNKVTVLSDQLIYTGSRVNLQDIKVYAIVAGVETLLVKDVDYVLTENEALKKQTGGTEVDSYILEATGIGNYSGTVNKSYRIIDDVNPVITGVSENGIYCGAQQITIEDANIKTIEIRKNGELIELTPAAASTNSKKIFMLSGTHLGDVYDIRVTDKSGNTASKLNVTVYDDHLFRQQDYSIVPGSDGLKLQADCYHGCGTTDTKNRFYGRVEWDYNYSYDIDKADGTKITEVGIQQKDARATYAKVELVRDGVTLATVMLDCADTCGRYEDSLTDSKDFVFDSYDAANPLSVSGNTMLPTQGDYEIVITPMTHSDDEYSEALAYKVYVSEDYSDYGYKGTVLYHPDCFFVTWEVSLIDNPMVGNKAITPDALYVKVLYGYNADDDDEDYNVIMQHTDNHGERCEAVVSGNIVSYQGMYPVWKYQGKTHKSYYHRIYVTGYEYQGEYFDISEYEYKSPHGNEYVSYYDFEADKVSEIIKYDLIGNNDVKLPVLVINENNGGDTVNAVSYTRNGVSISANEAYISRNSYGSTVSKNEIDAYVLSRPNYEFKGLYMNPDWEDTAEIPDVITLNRDNSPAQVYAHWRETLAPTGEMTVGVNKWKTFLNTITFGLLFKDTQTVTIEGFDGENDKGVINSGVKKIDYYVSSVSLNEVQLKSEDINWKHYNGFFKVGINPEEECVVYARIEDNAGNVSYISSQGLTFDKIPPVIAGAAADTTYCEAVTITVSDNHFHKLLVNGQEVELSDGKYTLSNNSAQFGMNYKLEAVDAAGNITVLNNVQINKGHAYAFEELPVFTWKGTSSATAAFICEIDNTHEMGIRDCDISKSLIPDEGYGNIKYTAHVRENGKDFYSYKYAREYVSGNFIKEVIYDSQSPATGVKDFEDLTRDEAEDIIKLPGNGITGTGEKLVSENLLHIYLDVRQADRDEIRANGDEAKIEEAQIQLGDAEIWQLLDISLWFKINGGIPERLITTGDRSFEVTIKLSPEMINQNPDVKRYYHVVRVHHSTPGDEGEVKIYETPAFDEVNQTISFDADRFSTYAILYRDEINVVPTPSPTPSSTPGVTPGATPSSTPGVTPTATPSSTPGAAPTATPGPTEAPSKVVDYYENCYINAGTAVRVLGRYNVISITEGGVNIVNNGEIKKFAKAKYNEKTGETIISTKNYKRITDKNAIYHVKIKNDAGKVRIINVEIVDKKQQKYWKNKNIVNSSAPELADPETALASEYAKIISLKTVKGTDSVLRDIRWYADKKTQLYTDQNVALDKKGREIFYYSIDQENGTIKVAPVQGRSGKINITANINGKWYTVKLVAQP